MIVELWVGRPCASCEEAERLWRVVASEFGIELVVRDIDLAQASPERARALPLLCVDGRALLVGVPEVDVARAKLGQALTGEAPADAAGP